jgi:hypothetical protein
MHTYVRAFKHENIRTYMHAYVHTLNFRGPRCIAVAKQTPKKETKNGKALQRVKKQKKVIKMPKDR